MNCAGRRTRAPRPAAPPTHPSWATHAYSYRARGEAAHGPSFRRKSRFATNGRWSWMHHNGSAATPRPAAAAVRTAGTSSSLLARLSVRRCWCSDSPGHRRRCRRGGRVPFTVKACAESASPYLPFKPLDLEQSCQASSEHRVRTRPVLHARLCVIFIMTYSTLAIRNFCAPPVAAAPSAGGSGAAPRRQPARSAARRKREVLSAQRKTFTKRKWVLRVSETVQRERTPLSSQAAY